MLVGNVKNGCDGVFQVTQPILCYSLTKVLEQCEQVLSFRTFKMILRDGRQRFKVKKFAESLFNGLPRRLAILLFRVWQTFELCSAFAKCGKNSARLHA